MSVIQLSGLFPASKDQSVFSGIDIYCLGHSCFVLGLVAGSDRHSDPTLRLLPAVTCQLTADSLL